MTAKRFVAALAKASATPHNADKLPRFCLPHRQRYL
jgi:hypothetical protein